MFTSLTKEAFPIIRYRTPIFRCLILPRANAAALHVRMQRITGRSDDMLIIRGVNVFPQVESVLMQTETLSPFIRLKYFAKAVWTIWWSMWKESTLDGQSQESGIRLPPKWCAISRIL